MSKDNKNRLIALATSICGGVTVQFFFRKPLLATLTSVFIIFVSLLLMAKSFPIKISLDFRAADYFGYEKAFKDQEHASQFIIETSRSTKRLDILLIRGHSFFIDHESLFERMIRSSQSPKIRILLLLPDGAAMKTYLNIRNFSSEKRAQYLEKCKIVYSTLSSLKSLYDLRFAYYDFFPSWKLIITDARAFIAGYDANTRGSKLKMASYHDMGKPFFISFSNYFEEMWKQNPE